MEVWNHHEPQGLGQGGYQKPDGHSDRAPEFLCGAGRNFQKDNHLCSTLPIRPLWSDGIFVVVVKQQSSIDHHVTRIRPSIFIGKEHQAHHSALSSTCKVHHNLFYL
jgi:hypothetical protein